MPRIPVLPSGGTATARRSRALIVALLAVSLPAGGGALLLQDDAPGPVSPGRAEIADVRQQSRVLSEQAAVEADALAEDLVEASEDPSPPSGGSDELAELQAQVSSAGAVPDVPTAEEIGRLAESSREP